MGSDDLVEERGDSNREVEVGLGGQCCDCCASFRGVERSLSNRLGWLAGSAGKTRVRIKIGRVEIEESTIKTNEMDTI